MLSTDSPTDIETILASCERDLAAGGKVDLRKLGFWRAVSAVKHRREWTEKYADRIGAIDRQAFERAVRPTWPPAVGTSILSLGAAAGAVPPALPLAPPRKQEAAAQGELLVPRTGAEMARLYKVSQATITRTVAEARLKPEVQPA
jgi:hypothetical protein